MMTRAAQSHHAGHMRPTGRVFETPGVDRHMWCATGQPASPTYPASKISFLSLTSTYHLQFKPCACYEIKMQHIFFDTSVIFICWTLVLINQFNIHCNCHESDKIRFNFNFKHFDAKQSWFYLPNLEIIITCHLHIVVFKSNIFTADKWNRQITFLPNSVFDIVKVDESNIAFLSICYFCF